MRLFLAAAILFVFFSVPAVSQELVVRPGESIQAAIDAAPAGAVIVLSEGRWEENVKIEKSLTLRGTGVDGTVIAGVEEGYPVIWIAGPEEGEPISVAIQGLSITEAEGKCADPDKGICAHGVLIEGRSQVAIASCTISENPTGIVLFVPALAEITGCTISGNGGGIGLLGSAQAMITGCTISDNRGGIALSNSARAEITDSTISENKEAGIELWGSAQATVEGNEIINNGGYGVVISHPSCYNEMPEFRGEVLGCGNTIPSEDEPDGNRSGAVCPEELSFLKEPCDSGQETEEESPSVTHVGIGESSAGTSRETYLELLGLIPDSYVTRIEVMINDYSSAVKALGILRPGPEANYETMMQYVMDLYNGGLADGPYISGFDPWAADTLQVLKDRAGYDLRNVNQSIIAGEPPQKYNAIALNLLAEVVMSEILECSQWPPPNRYEYRGVPLLSWGEDFAMNLEAKLNPPVFDQFGRGARLAFHDNLVFHTVWTDGIKQMIDARLDNVCSLADVEDFYLLAQGLSTLNVYSAILTNQTQSQTIEGMLGPAASSETIELVREKLLSEVVLRPYQVFATSIGHDSNGFYMGLVLVHDNPQTATLNETLLLLRLLAAESLSSGRPWREYFDVYRAEIKTEGRVVVAKVPIRKGYHPLIWRAWVSAKDPLLLHD